MTPASASHPVHAYLQFLSIELSRGIAAEHTHRSALKTLIESAASGLLATNEPKATQRENKPDYIVRKAASVLGFVEAKDVDKSLKGSNEVEKPRFENGRVWIIATQYFDGVSADTWRFKVSGYAVCEKWLKDRKNPQLDFADIQHYGAVVARSPAPAS